GGIIVRDDRKSGYKEALADTGQLNLNVNGESA
ncbi:MAG: hypothetical protein RLZZ400_481, partial [Actinomycetota bacterium]